MKKLVHNEAADCLGVVYFLVVPWILAKFSPPRVIYGGKGCSLLCKNSIFFLDPQKKVSQDLFVKPKLPHFVLPPAKSNKIPNAPQGIPSIQRLSPED